MAAFYRSVCKNFHQLKLLKACPQYLSSNLLLETPYKRIPFIHTSFATYFARQYSSTSSTSDTCKKLMQFFDDEKNWDVDEVKVGRSWTKEDMRIKSNEDLHKLWFVLLKERNMLLTMEHACKEEVELFPSAERIDKVRESMENLEEVVRERNKAYFELETGELGERPGKLISNQLGIRYFYRMSEHLIPKYMNQTWRDKYKFGYHGAAVHKFLRLYRERLYLTRKRERTRQFNQVQQVLKKTPSIDLEAVKQHFPNVDIEKARRFRRAYGNHEHNS